MPRTESELYATEYHTLGEAFEAEFPLFWEEFGPSIIDNLTDAAQIESRKAIARIAFGNALWVGQTLGETAVMRMLRRLATYGNKKE